MALRSDFVSQMHGPSAATAGAYGTAFWWSFALSAAALGPCIWLTKSERKTKRARVAAASQPGGEPSLAEIAA